MRLSLKNLCFLFAFFATASLSAQYKPQTQSELETELSKMEKKWAELKKQNVDSYRYENTCYGGEGDFSFHIVIEVADGKVQKATRKMLNIHTQKVHRETPILAKDYAAEHVGTMEEIFEFGRQKVLKANASENYRHIHADAKGLPQSVNYSPKNLADACPEGYHVSNFSFKAVKKEDRGIKVSTVRETPKKPK
jgi:hypothetical protein